MSCSSTVGERRIALRLAYDGTGFVGSQWQPQGRTVQHELETAWAALTQEQQRMTLAGRTDSGVHAAGQVAHVDTASRHTVATMQRALNARLPDDIRVLAVWEAAPAFHARFSARWRSYRYLLDTQPVAMPQLRHLVLHVGRALDVSAMQAALAQLKGEHDFAAFANLRGYQRSTVRVCQRAACVPYEVLGRPVLAIELVANAFLRQMIRIIVGTVLLVGQGQLSEEAFAAVLHSRERRHAGPTVAPHGLTLLDITY